MIKTDETSGLTDQEYRDGLSFARMVKAAKATGQWPVFLAFCNKYINDKKEAVFSNVDNQLTGNFDRGRAMGVSELLVDLNTRIELALAQEQREFKANSAGEKEKE